MPETVRLGRTGSIVEFVRTRHCNDRDGLNWSDLMFFALLVKIRLGQNLCIVLSQSLCMSGDLVGSQCNINTCTLHQSGHGCASHISSIEQYNAGNKGRRWPRYHERSRAMNHRLSCMCLMCLAFTAYSDISYLYRLSTALQTLVDSVSLPHRSLSLPDLL